LEYFSISKEIKNVHFKEQLLSHFTEAQTQSDGEKMILIFKQEMEVYFVKIFYLIS